jgi:polysaccharide export outer membrane protein
MAAVDTEKSHKDLIEYILNAQKLGLKEPEIRQNAVKAGWDKASMEEAFKIVKYLNTTTRTNGADKGRPALLSEGMLGSSTGLPEGYRVGAGDVIAVVVWKEPDASVPETMVRADGKITLPLVKEVEIVGYTPTELEKDLAEKYARYIPGADVTVVVKEITSRKVYMIGAVKKEGPLLLLAPMTVLQAITEAGGLTDYAKRKKIYILRTEKGKQTRLPFDYNAVIKGEHQEQNISVQPGDSIVIPH